MPVTVSGLCTGAFATGELTTAWLCNAGLGFGGQTPTTGVAVGSTTVGGATVLVDTIVGIAGPLVPVPEVGVAPVGVFGLHAANASSPDIPGKPTQSHRRTFITALSRLRHPPRGPYSLDRRDADHLHAPHHDSAPKSRNFAPEPP